MLSNATLLLHERVSFEFELENLDSDELSRKSVIKLNIFGAAFSWPVPGKNPYLEQIDDSVDIIVAHCPAKGFVDKCFGCNALLSTVNRVKPKVVISGHIHDARGIMASKDGNITFVNAANAGDSHTIQKQPIVLDLLFN